MTGQADTTRNACHCHAEIDLNSDSTHAKVVRLVGREKNILELGPATGYMTHALLDQGCSVVAVEIDAEAAKHAERFCERMLVADVEELDLITELGRASFDVVVAADVLEHLKDPLSVLKQLRGVLRPKGYMVASIPNVAHGSVRLALLGGSFPYSEMGLLDRTHLRFLTLDSIEKLFEDAGFAIGHLDRQQRGIEHSEVPYGGNFISPELVRELERDPEALTYQFVFVAYPLPRAELRWIQARMRHLANARDAAERTSSELREAREAAESEVVELRRAAAERDDLEIRLHEMTAYKEAVETELRGLKTSSEREVRQLRQAHEAVEIGRAELRRVDAARGELETKLKGVIAEKESLERARAIDRDLVERQSREFRDARAAAEAELAELRERLIEHEGLKTRTEELTKAKEVAERKLEDVNGAAEREVAHLNEVIAATEAEVTELRQALALHDELERGLSDLTEAKEAAEEEVVRLRETVHEQADEIERLGRQAGVLADRERELREMLLDAHDQLLRRDSALEAVVARAAQQHSHQAPEATAAASARPNYQQLIGRVRQAVDAVVPIHATVLVISKGDNELVKLNGRQAWHFPQGAHGVYAGHHPADSAAAITHLESLRAKGAHFLVLPQTGFWWLDHYTEFRQHLKTCYREVLRQDDACRVFDLRARIDSSAARRSMAHGSTAPQAEVTKTMHSREHDDTTRRLRAAVRRFVSKLSG